MTPLAALWLPIVVSAVVIFIVSSVIHTVMPWHKGDFDAVPDEDAFSNAVRPMNIPPGDYITPKCNSMKEMGSPEFKAKMERGPVMLFTVMPKPDGSMTAMFVQWFIYLLVVAVFAAYVAGVALAPGAGRHAIWRFTGTTALAAFFLGSPPISIWYHRKWSTTWKQLFDSLIYAAITAVVFGMMWPEM